jgi:alpha-methylacyl-CoA racemase
MRARGVYHDAGGVVQPAPAPRFSRTPGAVRPPPDASSEDGRAALRRWGAGCVLPSTQRETSEERR